MIVAFASNQVMFAKGDGSGTGTIESITTDPVPMNGMNQASAILNVHCYLDASPSQSPQLTVTGQVSNDGVNWVDTAVVVTASATGTQAIKTGAAEGQFIRFKFEWSPEAGTNGSNLVFITFDLHVRLDHS